MRSRIAGTLLPVALAAATVTALGAPATAEEAPPPAEQTYSEEQCAYALKILSYFKLLPEQPDFGRVLCSLAIAKQQEPTQQEPTQQEPTQQNAAQQDPYSEYVNELSTTYTTETGQSVQENKLLGLPVAWPKSLTVHVPTINERWHSYSSPQH